MQNADEPLPESLADFEKNLAQTIKACANLECEGQPDLTKVSW